MDIEGRKSMGHYIEISNLGSIDHCKLDINEMTVLTGPQASGKSTIAKAVYFFRTIKDDVLSLLLKHTTVNDDFLQQLGEQLSQKFVNLFGELSKFSSTMSLEYFYEKENAKSFIKIIFTSFRTSEFEKPKLWVKFGADIYATLTEMIGTVIIMEQKEIDKLQVKLAHIFRDDYETIFIPSGRSTITLLSDHFPYMLSTMEEWQREKIDYCTRNFIKLILKVRPWFSEQHTLDISNPTSPEICEVQRLSKKTLGAKYQYINNEERLYFTSKQRNIFVKINFSSSGQQEAVWVFNLLTYFQSEGKKVFIITEEPEAHLYPESQMHIIDALAIFAGGGNSLMITTHSPYILGELNNLILCGQVPQTAYEQANSIVNELSWIKSGCLNAFHVNGGTCENAISESGLIMNELIDGASEVINERCDKLLDLLEIEVEE